MWRIGLAFLAGHCCIHGLAQLPSHEWLGALALGATLAWVLRSRIALACIAGLAWAWLNAATRLAHDLPPSLEGVDTLVTGYVASLPDPTATDPQFILEVVRSDALVSERLRLAWYQAPVRPQPGESWQLVVRLKRRNGFANPGGFDHEAQLFRDGIGATGYVRDDARNERLATATWRHADLRVRAWIAARIASALDDHRALGILQGLAVGDTQAMTDAQWRVLAATGTTHLMAISGLHISMIAALGAWAAGHLVRLRRAQALRLTRWHGQVIGGLTVAFLYSILAGLSVPTQRTLITLCIWFAARALRREASSSHAFGLALIAVLIVDPFAPLAVGAWLSFGAVAVLLFGLSGRLGTDRLLAGFTRTQLIVTIGLTPLLAVGFGQLSLVSPFANALAVPLFTLILVPTVLIGALVASFSLSTGGLILGLASAICVHAWPALEWLATLPHAQWHPAHAGTLAACASVAGVLLLLAPGIHAMRWVGVLLCLPALMDRPPPPLHGDFRVATLDVGQGLAVIVTTHSHVLVYDAGPAFQSGRDTGEMVVLPYLRDRGIRRVDLLAVSHGDLDHRGGANSVLAGMPADAVLTGPSVAPLVQPATLCRAGMRWTWDAVEFEVLHPMTAVHERDNDSSCVIRIASRAGSVLLTGDIEAAAERSLVASGLPRTTIVIVPHHGSRSSSTDAFTVATRPELAIASAGYRNRWNFPRPDVVDRWRAVGARVLATSESGAIEVDVGPGTLRVHEYRHEHARYWRRPATRE
jgi:competence protein ComEC